MCIYIYIYIYVYIYIYMYMCIYIYIYTSLSLSLPHNDRYAPGHNLHNLHRPAGCVGGRPN